MIGEARFSRLRAAFDVVLELDATDRPEAIRRLSGADSSFAAELSALLDAAERSTTPLDAPPLRPSSRPEVPPPEGDAGDGLESVPGYRLIEPIGRGGSSHVYLAEQLGDGFVRPVALKILSRWVDASLLRRFRAEQRILAALEHPGIARLYDAGIAPSGRPYLAMELVRGTTLVEHCERTKASIRERIALFLKVLQAVEHAHSASIAHLDLKPGNILVAPRGEKNERAGRGEPKLLDFGIARLQLAEGGEADLTETRHRGMTPAYASPEQVGGAPVGPSSDIYSLGVVLYELLSGRRPYKLAGTSLETLERAIREDDPEPPGLGGDLDAILSRALRKEPAERYASAADFAADLSRYLDGRPVLARRGSLLYRVGKEVRRRRGLWANAALATLLLAGIVVWRLGGMSREGAPGVVDPLRSPWLAMPVAESAREAYAQGLQDLARYDTAAAVASLDKAARADPDQPLVRAALATAHGRAGHDALARAAGQQALDLAGSAPRESRLLVEAVALETAGRREEEGKLRRSLWVLQPANFEVGHLLATSLIESGAPEEALAVTGQLRALPAGKSPEADLRIGLIEIEALNLAGRPQEAVEKAKAIAARASALRLGSLEGRALLQGSQAYDTLGEDGETRALAERARRRLAPRGELSGVARSLSLLCLASFRQSRHDDVERVCGESVKLHRKVGSATGAARALGILGVSRERRGLLAEARATFAQALAIEDHNFFGDRLGRARHLHNLANVESELGNLLAAEDGFRKAIAIQREAGTELSLVRGLCALAAVLSRRGLIAEAEAALEEAEPLARKIGSPRELGNFLWQMGDLARAQGETAKANAWYDQAETHLETVEEPGQMAQFAANRKQLAKPSDRSCRDLESSVRELERLGDRAATELAVGISRCWSEAGSTPEAKRWYALAEKAAASSQLLEDRLELNLARAAIALRERRFKETETILAATAARCREASLGTLLMETRLLEARLARARGDHPERVRTLAEELRRDALAGRFGQIAAAAGEILGSRGAA